MKPRKKIQGIGETFFMLFALAVLPYLPRHLIFIISRVLGSLAFFVMIPERRVALANLDLVYGDSLSEAEKKEITRDSFQTVALMVLDCFWFTRKTEERLSTYVEFDSSCKVYDRTKPAVVVTSHFGNWEVLGVAVAFRGHPCVSAARPLANAKLDKMLNRFRQITGGRIVSKHGAVRALLGALKKGERIALLLDQNTLPVDGGEFVKFFGLDVPISCAAARLSIRTGAPLVFIFCAPMNDGHYQVCVSGILDPREWDNDSRKVNQVIANTIEKQVRSSPAHWMWTYKRWKWIPQGGSSEVYPYYAIPYIDRKTSKELSPT